MQFLSSFCATYFIAGLSDFDLQMLCHHFTSNGQLNRQFIEQALLNGQLIVHPEIPQNDLSLPESNTPKTQTTEHSSDHLSENRSLITIRSDIKITLRQMVDQERIEAQKIQKQYQQKSSFGKSLAHVNSFATGLYSSGASFLTWMKDVNDVLNLNLRLLRIIQAAMAAENENQGLRYQTFKQTLAESEKKELVEALGFDPAKISVDKLKQVYELAKLVYDDHLTRIILTQFVKDYADAQHSLEWCEFSGGAAFEVILTALLAIATGGVGAIASLGAQAKKISQLKKLGKLLSELAEKLKNLPKDKPTRLRKLKAIEDRKAQKAQKPAPAKQEKEDKIAGADDGRVGSKSVVPDIKTLRQTGGGGFIDPANEMYDAIRASDSDVSKISENTGIKSQNIHKVKDHVFYNEHLLDKYVDYGIPAERARFDSDLNQAQAWQRLENGTHTDADITWLKHEVAERWYETKHNSGYTDAHNAAEKKWTGNPWREN